MNTDCVYISVVRDEAMYNRLVKDNPNNRGGDFRLLDNRFENKSVTERYNSFLDGWDYSAEAWFVFLHEDYEFLEPLSPILSGVSKACIYGTVGMRSVRPGSDVLWALNSNRDGSRLELYGHPIKRPVEVLTTDCNCMIVHSSLVKKHHLRFDEQLLFDFYTEDFEINAYERFGIKTKVLPVKNHHYSFGHVGKRFLIQRHYLFKKYAHASRVYRTTTCQLIGPMKAVVKTINQNRLLRRLTLFRRIRNFFYQDKYYRDGTRKMKIFGLKKVSKIQYAMPLVNKPLHRSANYGLLGAYRLIQFKVPKSGIGHAVYYANEHVVWTISFRRSVFALIRHVGEFAPGQIPIRSKGNLLEKVRMTMLRAFRRVVRLRIARQIASSRKCFGHTLMLGYNCEVAYRYLLAHGFVDSNFFAWVYSPSFSATLEAIEHLGELFTGELTPPNVHAHDMFTDVRFGLAMHSKRGDEAELRSRAKYLQEKFLMQLRDDESTLVAFKLRSSDAARGEGQIRKLQELLEAMGGKNLWILVIVQEADRAYFPESPEGYDVRTVDSFNPDIMPATDQIGDFRGWMRLWLEYTPLHIKREKKRYKFQ